MVIDGVEWHSVEERLPPQKTLLMVTGPSGYRTHKKFLQLAYVDEDFRPSHGGPLRWIDHANDALTDGGLVPTHWAMPTELP